MRKYALPAALLGGLMSCSDLPTATVPQQLTSPSNLSRDVGHILIPGQYIVRFRSNGASALSNSAVVSSLYGGTVDRVYSSAINGAAMKLADDAAAALRADPRVLSVEQDEVVRKDATTTQLNVTWGLDRIDQRTRPLSGSYVYGANGSGVTVYILDSGINFGQADFGGRAETGYDAITLGGNAADCEGHGSHVAGTVGSNTYGVAKNVRLVAVRVLDCNGNGSSSSVLAGIDWVTTHRTLPAVANMSIGGGVSATVNQAVQNSIAAGITYAVSAGNASADACNQSPASAPDALTIGATDNGDAFAGYSNIGSCVDMLAPGTNITSWWTGSGPTTQSGTSMSTPHVAGAAALYLQLNPTATPAQVRAALVGNATAGIVTGVPSGTPNLLLYIGFIQAPSAPVADFTSSCAGNVCSFDASSSTSSWATPSYQWTFGDASNGSGKTPTHTYATAGIYAVTLTITDPNGTNTKTSSVILNRAPTAVIATPAANASFVQATPVTFTGTGTDPEDGALAGASLEWSSNKDGVIGTGASLTTSTLSAGSHTITLTAKDAQGAKATATVAITITANQAPTAIVTTPANNAVFLLGSSVAFSGTGNDAEDGVLSGASLVWTSSIDGQLGTGLSGSLSTLSAGTHTITLTAKDSRSATGVASVTIIVNQAPVAAISTPANNASFAAGTPVSFTGTGTDPEDGALASASLLWTSSQDGQIGTGVALSTSTLTTGTHTITLTAKDSRGATATATRTIVITSTNQAPVAHFTASCPSFQCTLDATGSTDDVGIVKYGWTWGDGRSENKSMPTAKNTWQKAGIYTITLTVTDAGGLTNSTSKQVAVPDLPPVVVITAPSNGTVFQQFAPVTFSGSATDFEDGTVPASALSWSSSIDGSLGTGSSISSSALTPGTHTITLSAIDAMGVIGTATRTITIAANQAPTATITAPTNNGTYLSGASVSFTGTGNDPEDGTLGGSSLVWTSSRDGQIGTGTAFSTTSLSVGTHTITLTAKDAQNATGTATRSITVTVPSNHAPVASYAISCVGLHCSADASSSTDDVGIVSYGWDWGNGKSKTVTTPTTTTTFLTSGVYTVKLTVTDGGGLTNTIAKQTTIGNQSPSAAIASPANNASFPQGAAVTLTGSASDPEDGALTGSSLAWTSSRDGALGTGTNVSITSLSPGTHAISLTATDAQGARDTATVTITIAANQPPIATIASPSNNSSFIVGSTVSFSGTGSDAEDGALTGVSLVWTSNRDGQIGTGVAFSTSALSIGTHTITLTAKDSRNATGLATLTVVIAANQAPTATISTPANNTTFLFGTSVSLVGAGNDAEDGTLGGSSLVWTSNRDGQIGVGTSLTKSNLSAGTHTITLTAKDSRNATGVATITVVINAPPLASITSPTNNMSVAQGVAVTLSGSATDAEDGALSGASLVWSSSRDGQIGTGASLSTSVLSVGTHTITLTATDSKGASATATVTLAVVAGANQPPVATIISPIAYALVAPGTSVTFTGTGVDAEDGVLTGASLVWTSSLDGQIGTGVSFTTSSLTTGTHIITLTVKDAKGSVGATTRTMTIRLVQLR